MTSSSSELERMFESLESRLRWIAHEIVMARPELSPLVSVGEHFGPSLVLRSPSNDESRRIVMWSQNDDLGLGFGPWHTHGDIARATEGAADDAAALLAILWRIVDDQLVITVDLDGPHADIETVLDLSVPDAMLDSLTTRWAPRAMQITTWSGRSDRSVACDDA